MRFKVVRVLITQLYCIPEYTVNIWNSHTSTQRIIWSKSNGTDNDFNEETVCLDIS